MEISIQNIEMRIFHQKTNKHFSHSSQFFFGKKEAKQKTVCTNKYVLHLFFFNLIHLITLFKLGKYENY